MKATRKLLVKALDACAKAHKVEGEHFADDGQYGVYGTTVPIISDVRMICEAFFGKASMVEVSEGFCITIYMYEEKLLKQVNEDLLVLALPYATKL